MAIIGAGPIGLAAAAHVLATGGRPIVLERGRASGASVRDWSHVRIFSPWSYNIDPVARRLLLASGWREPHAEDFPTGGELVRHYLEPLSKLPALATHLRFGHEVTAVARRGVDKLKTQGRGERPFTLRVRRQDGAEEEIEADAVIDASGTWTEPSPLGGDGLPAIGEDRLKQRLSYGIPDVLGADRRRYAGKSVAVAGAGHSAIGTLVDLATLAKEEGSGRIRWLIRSANPTRAYGGGDADALPERGALGSQIRLLVEAGQVELVPSFRVEKVDAAGDGLALTSADGRRIDADRVVVATGFRPALSFLSELRLALDPALECPSALAPLIDPNVHSCGTVPPHGADVLGHPEPGFFVVGMKSYGRAPTFLMRTGYEQVRSVVAHIMGDHEAARRVELTLPATGVCSGPAPKAEAAGCCAPSCCDAGAAVEATPSKVLEPAQ
ncbi:MAG: NAD(P)-binding domain-containing protein [Proteobacteria bacterium]|nr:NAD(P)-binding domain-containing protein [Pseudomonadota bacterium]MBI3499196.1 NAD(P)-binding domain-containing protein [Pseudomonadota bacterium]